MTSDQVKPITNVNRIMDFAGSNSESWGTKLRREQCMSHSVNVFNGVQPLTKVPFSKFIWLLKWFIPIVYVGSDNLHIKMLLGGGDLRGETLEAFYGVMYDYMKNADTFCSANNTVSCHTDNIFSLNPTVGSDGPYLVQQRVSTCVSIWWWSPYVPQSSQFWS